MAENINRLRRHADEMKAEARQDIKNQMQVLRAQLTGSSDETIRKMNAMQEKFDNCKTAVNELVSASIEKQKTATSRETTFEAQETAHLAKLAEDRRQQLHKRVEAMVKDASIPTVSMAEQALKILKGLAAPMSPLAAEAQQALADITVPAPLPPAPTAFRTPAPPSTSRAKRGRVSAPSSVPPPPGLPDVFGDTSMAETEIGPAPTSASSVLAAASEGTAKKKTRTSEPSQNSASQPSENSQDSAIEMFPEFSDSAIRRKKKKEKEAAAAAAAIEAQAFEVEVVEVVHAPAPPLVPAPAAPAAEPFVAPAPVLVSPIRYPGVGGVTFYLPATRHEPAVADRIEEPSDQFAAALRNQGVSPDAGRRQLSFGALPAPKPMSATLGSLANQPIEIEASLESSLDSIEEVSAEEVQPAGRGAEGGAGRGARAATTKTGGRGRKRR